MNEADERIAEFLARFEAEHGPRTRFGRAYRRTRLPGLDLVLVFAVLGAIVLFAR